MSDEPVEEAADVEQAIDDATDITELGGWRHYIAQLKKEGAL